MTRVQQKCHVCLVALTPFISSTFSKLPCCQCEGWDMSKQSWHEKTDYLWNRFFFIHHKASDGAINDFNQHSLFIEAIGEMNVQSVCH